LGSFWEVWEVFSYFCLNFQKVPHVYSKLKHFSKKGEKSVKNFPNYPKTTQKLPNRIILTTHPYLYKYIRKTPPVFTPKINKNSKIKIYNNIINVKWRLNN
jgi:hypothetical protein